MFSALQRSRSILNSSRTSGLGRLRATSSSNDQGQTKKAKKEDLNIATIGLPH